MTYGNRLHWASSDWKQSNILAPHNIGEIASRQVARDKLRAIVGELGGWESAMQQMIRKSRIYFILTRWRRALIQQPLLNCSICRCQECEVVCCMKQLGKSTRSVDKCKETAERSILAQYCQDVLREATWCKQQKTQSSSLHLEALANERGERLLIAGRKASQDE